MLALIISVVPTNSRGEPPETQLTLELAGAPLNLVEVSDPLNAMSLRRGQVLGL